MVIGRTVRFHEYGEPLDVLQAETTEVDDPPPGRVRIKVAAAGLNPADWELCRGFMPGNLPRGIGLDVSGVIDAVGEGVETAALGDRVFGVPDFTGQPSAGVADFAILRSWFAVPEGLDMIEASVLTMPVQTSAWTLAAMGVGPETTLLIHGAGGAVGFAAVQVALRMGARVLATCGPTYAADLEGYRAEVTSYGDGMVERVRQLAGQPIDLVLDTAPTRPGALADLIEIAGDANKVYTISNHDEARQIGAHSNLDVIAAPVPLTELMPLYAGLAANGEFRVPIGRIFPFPAWREAVELSLTRHARGKVVLEL